MLYSKNCTTIWLSVLLLFLTHCGGGGGSSPAAAPPAVTASVSGTITVAAGSFIDSDVNDPRAPYASNNDSAHAQALRNPFIVGGFASFSTDRQDYYNVELVQGQVLTLSISDHSAVNDLDLFLKDHTAGNTLASSEGTSSLETTTVLAPRLAQSLYVLS